MARGAIRKYVSGRHLLKSLTDDPALPAFVKTLDPPVLKQLIEQVGVEDASPLIALTTNDQLIAVIDESIWTNPAPGVPDRFDPAEFLRWLETMLELGDEFVCERIETLDEDLLAAARGEEVRSLVATYKALGGGWQIREGNDYISDENRNIMQQRTNWGELMEASSVVPVEADERGKWRLPDR